MEIIAHRGYWTSPQEKNTPIAFRRAFENGFGVETDFRDSLGKLVVSHDVPLTLDDSVTTFLGLYASYPVRAPVALNIKSDGLQDLICALIEQGNLKSAFAFDMTVPDMRGYFSKGIPVYSRVSDHESAAFLDQAEGIWFDAFERELLDIAVIEYYLNLGKKITFVSSELHGRDYRDLWKFIGDQKLHQDANISICTDFPEEVRSFFSL